MIRPEQIRQKALNLYPSWQSAWLEDETFFPKVIPCDKQLDENLALAIESIHALRFGSKERLGYGYTIEWEERNSRRHGRNRFPTRILFETESDFLKLIGRQNDFAKFTSGVQRIRDRYPALSPWIRFHRTELVKVSGELDGLLHVIDYFVAHPRPDLFARELPIPLDTKFIERNQQILRYWLDLTLPPHAIRADEDHFERRFGLKYDERLVFVRFLDAETQAAAKSPWRECSLPLHTLANYPLTCQRVIITENKVNLLTLPHMTGTIAIGGMGYSVTDLRCLHWLLDRDIWYWGDIDVDGFEILSALRRFFPQTRSLMMDDQAVHRWRDSLGTPGNHRRRNAPNNLTQSESLAYEICSGANLRIEQERIPQDFVHSCISNCSCNSDDKQ